MPPAETPTVQQVPQPKPLSPAEFTQLVGLARRAIRADVDTRRALNEQRISITPATFYSEIPRVEDIEGSFEFLAPEGPYNDAGVFDPAVMGEFLAAIGAYADEFDPPAEGDRDAPEGYFWANPAFSFSDAMAYYCVLRHTRPAQVVEIGSGFSTLVALKALEANGAGRLCCVEPYPMPWLERLDDRIELVRSPVQALGAEFFNARLADGDVLFIDSTHTVKAGSDCLHVYLRLLPALKARLTVHAHDIYLPFPLPRSQFDRHVYWTEQYLLYAYLLDNPRARVVYGSVYHHRLNRSALDDFMCGRWASGGASLWWTQEPSSAIADLGPSPVAIGFEQARRQQKANPAPRWHKPAPVGEPADPALASSRYQEPAFPIHFGAPKFVLEPSNSFFMMGSCFARGLETALAGKAYKVLSQTDAFNGWKVASPGTTASGATNKYNLGAILNELRWGLGQADFPRDALVEIGPDCAFDPHMSPVFTPGPFEEALARRSAMSSLVSRVAQADVVILTLGLVEVWRDNRLGLIANTTPDPRVFKREPSRFVFHRLSYGDNLRLLEQVRAVLQRHGRPGARLILTVSPVPLEATFTTRDVVEATTYSKSVLRVAAEDFALRHSNVDYFPSYEMVMNSPRQTAWAEDCRHVRGAVANMIMSRFIHHYLPQESVAPGEQLVPAAYLG